MSSDGTAFFWLALALGLVIPAALRSWDIGARLDTALKGAQMNRATAAGLLGISEAQLARAIAGVGPEHLSADRLTRLPAHVWMHLLVGLGEQFGLVEDADTRAEREARRAARQAKASLVRRDNAGEFVA